MTTPTAPRKITSLADYALLGRSGLRVSPLCLGTMTFGTEWGWGSDEATSRAMFLRYVEAGGNFIDTADGYTNGRSEELLGRFMKDAGNRERLVVATKFTFNTSPGDPNAGGNGRKNLVRALEGSLRRLGTDYVDLYWMHAWDLLTPIEEVLSALDAVVRAGKVRYIGLSDTPAWYAARAQTMAELRGWERVCALQLEYSLVERNIEREHVPLSQELGFGICPWSPLASGFLTGKYTRDASWGAGEGRLATVKGTTNPVFHKFSDRNWKILEALTAVAKEVGRSPAAVAIAWATQRPAIASTILGATRVEQLEDTLTALEIALPEPLRARLDAASAPDVVFPYNFFVEAMQAGIRGGVPVHKKPRWA